MRRILSSGLIGLGAFLIVAAAMIAFYAYPTLATVPTNYESTTMLEAEDAVLYDAGSGDSITVDLAIESYTLADSSVDPGEGNAVWVSKSSILRGDVEGASCAPDATEAQKAGCFQQGTERIPFDAKTGAGVSSADCGCESSVDVSDPVTGETEALDTDFVGQVLKFPFETEQKDYDQWDSTTARAWPAVFEGVESLDGLQVYKFVQTITDQVVPGNPGTGGTRPVPGSIFDMEEATVGANYLYSVTKTFYVEPVTGAPVNRIEERNQRLILGDDTDTAVTALEARIAYTDEQVDEFVESAKAKSFQLGGMKLLFPGIALLLGLLAVGGGVLLGRGGRSDDTDTPTGRRQLVTA